MKVFEEKKGNIFKLLSEAISEGIIIVNIKQEIVASNEAANEMFGYAEGELIGKPLELLIPKQYRKNHDGHFNGFLKKSNTRQMGHGRDLYGLTKDGVQIPVEAGLNPFEIYGSQYIMALVSDISVRKEMEQELRQWSNIFNESLNEIFIFDSETLRFTNVNKGAQINIGYSLEELKNFTPVDIKPDFDETSFRELLIPLLDKTIEKLDFETFHQRKDGSLYPVEVHLQSSMIGDKQMFVAIILDISERFEYTQKLENTVKERTRQLSEALVKERELNDLKTKFLSLVSHEFKTPLSGIFSSINLLERYTESEQQDKRNKHIKTIRSKVKYLDNILTDFLSVERLESGNQAYKFSNFPISKVINEVVYDANMLLKDGQKINYPNNIDEIYIDFDENILQLIMVNLVNNAIKYSPEYSTVDIDFTFENNQLTIEIKDEGIGIPDSEKKYMFNRYFRAENALLIQGTGIGLNIVKSHLENLGGTITFESEENVGSVFSIKVPLNSNNS
ncbi:sensor histidine kinase [Ulvibacter antarcticus]|uniref:histidine kinase n=1 Tax=Ulvibacter antarcticus TaxID=442714 RepID=A0A3L9YDA4_9FLAO|nr:PAS domain-containing sensor histidine kinase [Ulvibacter antarcticus]RMA58703.1 PAS domain S-box-containing protein [Ulvibacter antarcticus]